MFPFKYTGCFFFTAKKTIWNAANTGAFQEISREMIDSTLCSFGKRLKMVIECHGRHVEKKNV